MSKQDIYDYLYDLDLCKICILRYLYGRCTDYLDVDKALLEVSNHLFLVFNVFLNNISKLICICISNGQKGIEIVQNGAEAKQEDTNGDGVCAKRKKENICSACLGIFQDDMIEKTARKILDETDLHSYECETVYTSVSLPILLQIRELSMWIALYNKFPDAISKSKFQ